MRRQRVDFNAIASSRPNWWPVHCVTNLAFPSPLRFQHIASQVLSLTSWPSLTVKTFPTSYRTLMFVTVFTTASHWTRSRSRGYRSLCPTCTGAFLWHLQGSRSEPLSLCLLESACTQKGRHSCRDWVIRPTSYRSRWKKLTASLEISERFSLPRTAVRAAAMRRQQARRDLVKDTGRSRVVAISLCPATSTTYNPRACTDPSSLVCSRYELTVFSPQLKGLELRKTKLLTKSGSAPTLKIV
jgi:hypothetical protein